MQFGSLAWGPVRCAKKTQGTGPDLRKGGLTRWLRAMRGDQGAGSSMVPADPGFAWKEGDVGGGCQIKGRLRNGLSGR